MGTPRSALLDPACEGKDEMGEGQGGIGGVRGKALSYEGRGA